MLISDLCFNIYGENAKIQISKVEVREMTFFAADVGANIAEGLKNMVVGLGVVFVVLIFLMFVISLFKFVNKLDKPKEKAPAAAPAPARAAVPAGPGTMANASVSIADEVEGPVAAAVLAAVAEECGGNFKVTSIKKSK